MFAARPLTEAGTAAQMRSATPVTTARYGALTAAGGLADDEAGGFGGPVCWPRPRASHRPAPAAARTSTATGTAAVRARRGLRTARWPAWPRLPAGVGFTAGVGFAA